MSALAAQNVNFAVRADILLAAVISLSLLRGKKYAAYFAVITGFLFDLTVGNPYCFSPFVFYLCAYFAPTAASPFSHKTPLSATLVGCMLLPIKSIITVFYLIAVWKDATIPTIIFRAALPEYLVNVLAVCVVFSVMRILMALFKIPVRKAHDERMHPLPEKMYDRQRRLCRFLRR